MLMKGKDGGDKAKARNSIRQSLIGEDIPMLWRFAISARLCMDSWLTPGTLLCYKHFHHNIAAVILSERALCYPFLFSKLFIRSHAQTCLCLFIGFLVVTALITGLHS